MTNAPNTNFSCDNKTEKNHLIFDVLKGGECYFTKNIPTTQ